MINEAKYDMRGFVLNQISSKKIGVDESKVNKSLSRSMLLYWMHRNILTGK